MKLVGASLSFCIEEILSGKVREEDVFRIITNTAFPELMDCLDPRYGYVEIYWRNHKLKDIKELLERMAERIVQPRLSNPNYMHSIASTIWHKLEDVTKEDDNVVELSRSNDE